MKDDIELIVDYPSKIADYLVEDKIDIGLVPVVTIPRLKAHYIISDYCIACDGEVASVALFSEVSLENIRTILLDYQSRTSVALLKILLRDHWKINPILVDTSEDFAARIKGNTAGLIIGDRAIAQRATSKFIYDLGLHWKIHTGLPFVFAAWISNKPATTSFIKNFNEANRVGLKNLEAVTCKIINVDKLEFNIYEYFTSCIQYSLSLEEKKGIEFFLSTLSLSKAKNV